MTADKIPALVKELDAAMKNGAFIRLVLSVPRGDGGDLVRVTVRPVMLKAGLRYAFTYRHKTRDIVKNYDAAEALAEAQQLLDAAFKNAALFTTDFDLAFPAMKKAKATLTAEPLAHDRAKNRHVETGKPYLRLLGLTDEKGQVLKNAQDKYRQIDKYIEILSGLLQQVEPGTIGTVADMGSGKGYLTFALADHLRDAAHITGVEGRADMVDLCNDIARQSGLGNVSFEQGYIADHDRAPDMLIALHACDTATDDALWLGIKGGSKIIVAAPCCQKQVRKVIDAKAGSLLPLMRHGIFEERLAEMATDAIRALILEYHGYDVKVFEFIALEHTAKNVMITAVKSRTPNVQAKEKILAQIAHVKSGFGITGSHYLEAIALKH